MRRLLLTSLVAVAACSGGGGQAAGSTVADSAGIKIVTSTVPQWGARSAWQVDTSPLISIGEAEGANHVLLVDVNGVRLLSDGRVAVASGADHAVLYFDGKGAAIARSGRDGAGPGEFRSIQLIGAHEDSLLLWDAQLDRSTMLGSSGTVLRTFALVRDDTTAATRLGFAPIGIFADGSLLLSGRTGVSSNEASGLRRDTIPLRRASADGRIGRVLAKVPGTETLAIVAKRFVSSMERPFGMRTVTATRGSQTLVGTGDVDGVTVFDSIGRVAALYRIDRARRSIPASDIEALGYRQGEELRQVPPEVATELRHAFLEYGVPGTLSTTYQMVVDRTGAIWLADDVGPIMRDSIPQRWTVLDSAGRWLGSVTTPRRFEVYQITTDRVVGVQRDENDVEYVRVLRLKR